MQNRFLVRVFVSSAIMMFGACTLKAEVQDSTYSARPSEAAAVTATIKDMSRITSQAQRTKTISDDDLTKIAAIAGDPKQHPVARVEALKPLGWLKSDKLTGTQFARIDQLIFGILREDDSVSDPEGRLKMYAAPIASRILRGKRFLAVLQPLTHDSCDMTRIVARNAYNRLKLEFGS